MVLLEQESRSFANTEQRMNEPRFSPRQMRKDKISPACAEDNKPDKQAICQQKSLGLVYLHKPPQ